MTRDARAREAKRLIDSLAFEPRAAGGRAEAAARAFCKDLLGNAGFATSEEEFTYSAFPGRWAVPLLGLLLFAWFAFVGSQARSHPHGAVGSTLPFLLLFPALGYMLFRIVPSRRLIGRRGTNLVAVRGASPPLWLLAHIDTKSQPVPMLVRIGGIMVAGAAAVVAVAVALAVDEARTGPLFWRLVCVAGAAASVVLMLSIVGDRSPGALDNATGVAAAVLAAAESPQTRSLGVVITSAEELGLQGARAWVARRAGTAGRAINFDGLDDVGTLTCMARSGSALAGRMKAVAKAGGWRVRFRGVLPGIMVDSVALTRAGWDAVTISKGNFSTLARIHTPGDSPDRLNGTGVAEAVEMVVNFIDREG